MRKVLSFVLVLSLVLGSFSMAFAATPVSGLSDIEGIANEDAIQVAFDLGIVTGNPDGTYLPEKAVTRAEFAAMITRAMAIPDSALAGYTATTFKDTVGYGWAVPYLAFCQSKGILLGDGAGNVMPGRTININEAVTMVLRAVGYTANSAELVGTWPANYVTIAQNVNLYDDVAKVVNVDKANAAQIIYNALTVQKVAVNSDGETRYLTLSGTTEPAVLLNTGLGCETKTGVILGDDGYSYDDAVFSIVKNVGAYGNAYVDGDDVMAFTKDSTALTGKLDGDKFKADGVKYSFTAPVDYTSPAAYILNGSMQSSTSTITAAQGAANGGEVTIFVELSGKNIKTLHSIVAWAAEDGGQAETGDLSGIKDGELFASEFDLDDDDEIVSKSFQLIGVTSLDKIAVDDVVYIYNDDDDVIRKVAVGTEVVTGEVTEVDGKKITVNGKVYEFYATGFEPYGAVDETDVPDAGDDVELVLDAYGKVYDIDATGSPDTFGVIMGSDIVAAGSIDDSRLKLYSSDDTEKTFKLESGSDMTWTPAMPWATGAGAATPGAIVKYALDKDGVIDSIDTAKYVSNGAASVTLESISLIHVGAQKFLLDSDVVVFVKDGSDYAVTNIKNVDKRAELNTFKQFCYVTNTAGDTIVAMVIDDVNASASTDDIYAVVTKITGTTTDGDPVQRIQGFAMGDPLDKKTSSNTSYAVPTTVSAVSVFKFELNSDGYIKSSGTAIAGSYQTATISGINSAKDSIKLGNTWYSLAENVKVYEVVTKTNDTLVDTYKISSVNALRESANYVAHIYDMVDDSDNRGYEVVVFVKY